MIEFVGSIEGNNSVIYAQVEGWYNETSDDSGFKSWHGALKILSGEPPKLIEGILIANGKKGKILVDRVVTESGELFFRGNGPIS